MEQNDFQWVKFDWDLRQTNSFPIAELPIGLTWSFAEPHHFQAILGVIINAYESDTVWKSMIGSIRIRLTERVGNTLGNAECAYLLVSKGAEIVAVSGICQYHWTNQNFLTGICVKKDFQRRGIGSFLLYKSLVMLSAMGLDTATVYTEQGSIADTTIYPRYSSIRTERADYLSLNRPLYQLPVKHNIYFRGNVQSLGLDTPLGYATAGVIKPGEFKFSTSRLEVVRILNGSLDVRLPGDNWKTYTENEVYEVTPGIEFWVRAKSDILYLCHYY